MASEIIRSRSNPLVRRLRQLSRRGHETNALLIEGARLIEEASGAGLDFEAIVASPRVQRLPRERALIDTLARQGTPLRWVEEAVLGSISPLEAPPGVLAVARRPAFRPENLLRGTPLLIVLDGLQNPGNVGAVLRAAEAAGATGALLTSKCADPLSWKALRGSMGSAFRLPHVRLPDSEVTTFIREAGIRVIGTRASGGQPPEAVDLRLPTALVMGGEGEGISPELHGAIHGYVSIPLHPPVESLNVAVAAGILLFEAARQRRR
jgi:TrmH family RNA methyltransferase